MRNFQRDLQALIENNTEHMAYVVNEMTTVLGKSKEEIISNPKDFDLVMQMFIATV